MSILMAQLLHHAYLVLFVWVLIEQGGLPVPSIPVFLAAGTMSAAHTLHVLYALPVVMLAALIADSTWFWLGRRYGSRVLETLCRFSMEASTCVQKTQGTVVKRGPATLLFAKFVPGLSTVAAPITGQAGVPYFRFAAYDLAGTFVWASAWMFAGRFFGDLIRRSTALFGTMEHFAIGIVLLGVLGIVVFRFVRRRQFVTELRGLRLEPAQLQAMIHDAEREGKDLPFIVDLRHPLDLLTDPFVVPGALQIGPSQLKERNASIPRDRDIVLYCTCPSEETSAKVAMELRRLGIRRVRPLRGGLQGWRDAGFPLQDVDVAA